MPPIPPTPEQIEFHYRLERELADRIRNAPADERRQVTIAAYDELFRKVTWHDGLRRGEAQKRYLEVGYAPFMRFTGRDKELLDIGCGRGDQLIALAAQHRRCVGLDVSAEVLMPEAERPANISFVLGDAVDLAVIPDASFDVVISNQLLEHLHPDDAPRHLAAVRRVLRPGGRYVFDTPSRLTGPHDVSRHFDAESTCFHLREYDFRSLLPMLRAAGFRRVRSPLFRDRMYRRLPWLPRFTVLPGACYLPSEALAARIPRGRLRRLAVDLFRLSPFFIIAEI